MGLPEVKITCDQCVDKECCKGMWVVFNLGDEGALYNRLHGAEVFEEDGVERVKYWMPAVCQWLGPDGLCQEYEHRPKFCKEWYCDKHVNYRGEGTNPFDY